MDPFIMTRIMILILAWLCLGATAPPMDQYRVHIDGRLHADQWISGYGYVVKQTDVQYRLRLDALPQWGRPHGIAFFLDSDLGTDLGPTTQENRLGLGTNATRIDLFRAEVLLANTIPGVIARLGRHTIYDALGFDALDGASLRITALPAVDLVTHAGMGLQTRWLNFGPVVPLPIDTVGRDRVGYVAGAGLETKFSNYLNASLGWRRHFGSEIQQEKIGVRLAAIPTTWLRIESSIANELVFGHVIDSQLGLRLAPTRQLGLGIETTYHYPHFSADTIWVAFARSPFHGAELSLNYSNAGWRYWVRGEGRLYADDAETPSDELWHTPAFGDGSQAWLGHAAIERRVGKHRSTVGASGSLNWGFGGKAAVASADVKLPLPWPASHRPIELNARLGGAWYEDAERSLWNGLSNWSVLGGQWKPDEGLAIGGQVEAFISDRDRSRARMMLTVRMENGW